MAKIKKLKDYIEKTNPYISLPNPLPSLNVTNTFSYYLLLFLHKKNCSYTEKQINKVDCKAFYKAFIKDGSIPTNCIVAVVLAP